MRHQHYICNMKFIKYVFLLAVVSCLFFPSCKKDQLLTDSSAKLDFSTDSVLFDTVFTSLGSTTMSFRIYNHHSQPLNISRVYLAMGNGSPFKLNVDGISGKSISDVEILGGDSLFVFVQVTVDPTSASSPLLIKDSVIFETNGNSQNVKLTAVGQNVYIHKPDHFPTNGLPPYSITGRENFDTILPNDKPHLFFGHTVIDSHCKLTMLAGTKCYFYNSAVLWVFDQGTLVVSGAPGNEVTFQGMRLEAEYKDVPGQWGKIWLSKGSKDNVIDWAIIKNGSIGVQADSTADSQPTLVLTNTVIKNMQAAAIFGQTAHIRSNNCLFANCGQYVAALTLGGNYSFVQCTFADFWTGSSGSSSSSTARTTPVLAMNNNYTSSGTTFVYPMDSCYFANCIIYGDQAEEVGIDTVAGSGAPFSYQFDHCVIKSVRSFSNSHYTGCFQNNNPGFKDVTVNDYELNSATSIAVNNGNTSIIVPFFDLNNYPRDTTPDIGAYEFH
ncbi:MAG: hypothetical protein JWP12_2860 [Bacteroidetes bacterium]|nr:hypothetical protein [Bacteroidota bacterium]